MTLCIICHQEFDGVNPRGVCFACFSELDLQLENQNPRYLQEEE